MTEQEIEIRAERLMDRLDHRFQTSDMSQELYDDLVADIEAWVKAAKQQAKGVFHG